MYIASPSPLGAPAVFTHLIPTTRISVPSPLDASETIVVNDFTTLVVPPDLYVMDLTTPSGVVRVPISSWQATLQTDRANYGQCVIPSVDAWLTEVAAATDFTVYRVATTNNNTIEHLMLDSAITLKQYYETPSGYVCTISGNYTGYTADEDPPTGYDRTLTGVRQITNTPGGIRVRCNIDFLLRPAQRAYVNGTPFIVSYINYYVLQGDAYMDVGERL
jgi:hypothetical protein